MEREEVPTMFLTEGDVQELLPMERALECVEASFKAQASGQAINRARGRIFLPKVSLHYMAAALTGKNWLGMKIYTATRDEVRFAVVLFDGEAGNLLAWMQADHLGRLRTGAASGIATKYMARDDASRVGLIGTGRQARTQLLAVSKVRSLKGVRVFGRNASRCREFCREMSDALGVPVEPSASLEETVGYGEIVITATSAKEPVVKGEWLAPGTHLNAVGANAAERRELDAAAVGRAALIAVDSLEQTRKEAGDLIQGFAELGRGWDGVLELGAIVAGSHPGRNSHQDITLFKSTGIAIWDIAVAGYIYQQALASRQGEEFQLW